MAERKAFLEREKFTGNFRRSFKCMHAHLMERGNISYWSRPQLNIDGKSV